MISKKASLLLTTFIALGLGACAAPYSKPSDMEDAKYWQRKNASSALYLQGPKAQQMLHENISTCVTEISELERLGEIRRAIPANYNSGNTLEAERTASQQKLDEWDSPQRDGYLYNEHPSRCGLSQQKLDEWDSPQRDGYLYNEHLEYHDFETCMTAKGWERLSYLPYSAVDKANADYLRRHGRKGGRSKSDRENVTSLNPLRQNPAPYKNVND